MAEGSIQFSQVSPQRSTSLVSTILGDACHPPAHLPMIKYARVNFCFPSRILTGKRTGTYMDDKEVSGSIFSRITSFMMT